MPAQNHLLKKAISLYQTGDCESSRRLLLGILRNDRTDQDAWIQYAETFESVQERLRVYEKALAAHPQMEWVQRVYLQLKDNPLIIPVTRSAAMPLNRPVQPRSNGRPAAANGQGIAQPAAKQPAAKQPVKQGSPLWAILSAIMIIALLGSTLVFQHQARVASEKMLYLQQEMDGLKTGYQANAQELVRVQQDYNKLLQDYQTAQGSIQAMTAQAGDLKKRSAELTQQYNTLMDQHNALNTEYQRVQGEYKTLTDNYNALTSQHQELQGQFQALQADHQALNDNYNKLHGQYTDLQNKYNDLNNKYAALLNSAAVPPYISVRERNITLAFYKTNGSLAYWNIPFDNLEKDIERGYNSRGWSSILTPKLALATNGDEKYYVVDFRPYVDAGDFTSSSNIADLYRQSGTDYEYIHEVWNTVTQLAKYTSDNGIETPRYPLETLLAGGGDCEDTAILFASMVKAAAPANWKVKLIYMNSKFPNDVMKPNHVAVEVITGSGDYIIETTNNTNMTPYLQKPVGWYFDV